MRCTPRGSAAAPGFFYRQPPPWTSPAPLGPHALAFCISFWELRTLYHSRFRKIYRFYLGKRGVSNLISSTRETDYFRGRGYSYWEFVSNTEPPPAPHAGISGSSDPNASPSICGSFDASPFHVRGPLHLQPTRQTRTGAPTGFTNRSRVLNPERPAARPILVSPYFLAYLLLHAPASIRKSPARRPRSSERTERGPGDAVRGYGRLVPT